LLSMHSALLEVRLLANTNNMLSVSQKLSPKLFDHDVEMVPIRKGFGEGLLEAANLDPRVVGLCADLTESTQMHFFKNAFPKRFIEMGVAEQNLVTVASGMAAMGKIPFVTSYAMFSPGRNWEQIRTTIAYNDRPVKIIGSHAGISVGPDGGTHQALEDIALMRVIPRMVVISPCDAIEARKATIAAAKTTDPTYIRLAREKTPIITSEESSFEIGKANVLFQPVTGVVDIAIFVTGALVHNAILAARILEKDKIGITVVNISTIKPLDESTILRVVRGAKAVLTVEEHQIAGGMGSAVAEFLGANFPIRIERLGIRDEFGQSGTPVELIKYFSLDEVGIVNATRALIKKSA